MASPGPLRVKALLAVLFLFTVSIAGCTGGDDEDQDPPEQPDDPMDDPEPPVLGLAVEDSVSQVILGEGVDLNITVSGDNATGTWLGIRWASATTETADNLTTDLFEGEVQADGDLEFPGTFTLSWTPTANQTYFVRANAQTEFEGNTTDHWSDEFVVVVLPEVEVGDFEADTTITMQLGGQIQGFDPDPAEISVGESVTWTNSDAVAHTATHSSFWDTGDVAASGDATISVRFNVAGTYAYECTIHDGMEAEIVVS